MNIHYSFSIFHPYWIKFVNYSSTSHGHENILKVIYIRFLDIQGHLEAFIRASMTPCPIKVQYRDNVMNLTFNTININYSLSLSHNLFISFHVLFFPLMNQISFFYILSVFIHVHNFHFHELCLCLRSMNFILT